MPLYRHLCQLARPHSLLGMSDRMIGTLFVSGDWREPC